MNIVNWFFGAEPTSVMGTGGIYRFNDGREVPDHVYATWEYDGGRTAVFSSIESNAFDHYYEAFFGTKATLILQGEAEAYLFDESTGKPATGLEVTPKGNGPALEASESRVADAAGRGAGASTTTGDRLLAYQNEISAFCSAVRTGTPLLCGPDRAMGSARACITAVEAIEKKTRLEIRRRPRRGRSGAPDADAVARSRGHARPAPHVDRLALSVRGYYKLVLPAWARGGTPIGKWSAAGYLAAATGPLAGVFHALGASAGSWIDLAVPIGLTLVGLSLMLGLFTRAGCWGAMLMLALFYLSAIPLTGAPVPEGGMAEVEEHRAPAPGAREQPDISERPTRVRPIGTARTIQDPAEARAHETRRRAVRVAPSETAAGSCAAPARPSAARGRS